MKEKMNTKINIIYVACAVYAFACFALLPLARAVSPRPDGDYPFGNTAEGSDALFSITNGANNAGVGFQALYSNQNGGGNTAMGGGTLHTKHKRRQQHRGWSKCALQEHSQL